MMCFKSDRLYSPGECSETDLPALDREFGHHNDLRRTSYKEIVPVRAQAAGLSDTSKQRSDISVQTEEAVHDGTSKFLALVGQNR